MKMMAAQEIFPARDAGIIRTCHFCHLKTGNYQVIQESVVCLSCQREYEFGCPLQPPRDKVFGSEVTTLLPLSWKFGVEIEVDWGETLLKKYYQKCAYTNIVNKKIFGIKYDGSLDDGVEFYSPILQGDKGLAVLKDFCDWAKFFPVNANCGFHLHIDMKDRTWEELHKIYWVYSVLEPLLLALLPRQRRQNSYCKKYRLHEKRWMNKIQSREDLGLVYFHRATSTKLSEQNRLKKLQYLSEAIESDDRDARYKGISLYNWFAGRRKLGTIEIRLHSGTTDFRKIYHWLVLNMAIMKQALRYSLDELKKGIVPNKCMEDMLSDWPETMEYTKERQKYFQEKYR